MRFLAACCYPDPVKFTYLKCKFYRQFLGYVTKLVIACLKTEFSFDHQFPWFTYVSKCLIEKPLIIRNPNFLTRILSYMLTFGTGQSPHLMTKTYGMLPCTVPTPRDASNVARNSKSPRRKIWLLGKSGLRTAGMMRWPGKIRANWKCDQIFSVMDLYTTLGKFAGADIPTDRPVDGMDQSDFLLGKEKNSRRDHVVCFFYGKLTAIRWKQFKAHMVIYDRFKSLTSPAKDLGVLPRIYNLRADPKERFDLMGRSGGTPAYIQIMQTAAPYLQSFKEFPNRDYTKMKRSK